MPSAAVLAAAGANVFLWWFAPFLSGGGYSSEALALLQGLANSAGVAQIKVRPAAGGGARSQARAARVWASVPARAGGGR